MLFPAVVIIIKVAQIKIPAKFTHAKLNTLNLKLLNYKYLNKYDRSHVEKGWKSERSYRYEKTSPRKQFSIFVIYPIYEKRKNYMKRKNFMDCFKVLYSVVYFNELIVNFAWFCMAFPSYLLKS
jgi:hypothetical protein